MTKYAPHLALKLIARCKLTNDERVELHRVARAIARTMIGLCYTLLRLTLCALTTFVRLRSFLLQS